MRKYIRVSLSALLAAVALLTAILSPLGGSAVYASEGTRQESTTWKVNRPPQDRAEVYYDVLSKMAADVGAAAPKKEVASGEKAAASGENAESESSKESAGGSALWDFLERMGKNISNNTIGEATDELLGMERGLADSMDQLADTINGSSLKKVFGDFGDTLKDASQGAYSAAGVLDGLGKVFGGLNIVTDLMDLGTLMQDGETRTSGKVIEALLLCTDIVLAVMGIIGAASGLGFFLFGLMIALLLAIVQSDWFKDWLKQNNGFLDTLDFIFESILSWLKTPANVNCYKPNIYIYSDRQRQVTVRFDKPQLLTTTIPDYSGLWQVETGEEGTLYDAAGNSYGFLFYESVTRPELFQTQEGFFIPAGDREAAYRQILGAYGFNETEISDFVEFWTRKLPEGVDYFMYPQLTDTVDAAMPVTISPAPEVLERIWFVFETADGRELPAPQVTPIRREDYTVVEWGGIILDEAR